jgi:hypothetical protein
MYHLCQKILLYVNNDSNSQSDFDQITANTIDVENIRNQVLPNMRVKEACKTVQDTLQYYAIRLHTSFVVSVLCRPALRRGERLGLNLAQKKLLADKCKQNLAETVRMYLKMHSLSVIPTRSWAFTYHSLSSAVLLGILGETKTDPEVRQLQGHLISALSATAAKEQTVPGLPKSDKDIELSGPLSRALVALKNIYDHGWVVEGRPVQQSETQSTQEEDQIKIDQQNAAIAMASMQNGMMPSYDHFRSLHAANTDNDCRIDYGQQMMSNGIQDSTLVDPTMEMSPMDLFDSIFWGEFLIYVQYFKLIEERSIPYGHRPRWTWRLRLLAAAVPAILDPPQIEIYKIKAQNRLKRSTYGCWE